MPKARRSKPTSRSRPPVRSLCESLTRSMMNLGPQDEINEDELLFLEHQTEDLAFLPSSITLDGKKYEIPNFAIACGAQGCAWKSTVNDLGRTVLIKVQKVCPSMSEVNSFGNEVLYQTLASQVGVAPKIFASSEKEGAIVMEQLDSADYKALSDFTYTRTPIRCKVINPVLPHMPPDEECYPLKPFLEDYQELAIFKALVQLRKAKVGYSDPNPKNLFVPLRKGLDAKIIDYGIIKNGQNPMLNILSWPLYRVKVFMLKQPHLTDLFLTKDDMEMEFKEFQLTIGDRAWIPFLKKSLCAECKSVKLEISHDFTQQMMRLLDTL